MIELTEKQREAGKSGEAICIAAPEIGEEIVLMLAAEYEKLQEMVANPREHRTALKYSMRQARTVAKVDQY